MTREQFIVLGFIVAAFVTGWLASALSGAAARRRDRDRNYSTAPQATSQLLTTANGQPPLAAEVGDALLNDAANDRMLSVLPADPAPSERELDLTDWGFSYGVAWARARDQRHHQDQRLSDDALAAEALHAAEAVFRVYTDGAVWERSAEERRAI